VKNKGRKSACLQMVLCGIIICNALFLSGCQSTPDSEIVTNKNESVLVAIEKEEQTRQEEYEKTNKTYTGIFTNKQGDISFLLDVVIPVVNDQYPLIQVTPRTISSEQAKNVALALFGETTWYEYSEVMSKEEIEETIISLRKHISDPVGLKEYYGGDEQLANQVISWYEALILEYEEMYNAAPKTVQRTVCEWEFYPTTHYFDFTSFLGVDDEMSNLDKTEYIVATTEINKIPYLYNAMNRDANDYRLHTIIAYMDDEILPISSTYSNKEPNETDMERVRLKTIEILEKMGFEHWLIDSCVVTERNFSDESKGYRLVVEAIPTYEGIQVTKQGQIMNLKSEDSYASNYSYENITIEFCGDQIAYFEYTGALEVLEVIEENVQLLSFDEVLDRLKSYKETDDLLGYAMMEEGRIDVNVNNVELGLARIRIKNNYSDFYLIPAYTFNGTYSYYEKDGTLIYEEDGQVAVINAVDGSIINTRLGY